MFLLIYGGHLEQALLLMPLSQHGIRGQRFHFLTLHWGLSGSQTSSFITFVSANSTFYLDGFSAMPSNMGSAVHHITNPAEFPVYTGTATWDPGSIAASGYLANDFVCLGAELGMVAHAGAGVDVTDLIVSATVTASDVVTVVLFNPTVGAIDLASSIWNVSVTKLF